MYSHTVPTSGKKEEIDLKTTGFVRTNGVHVLSSFSAWLEVQTIPREGALPEQQHVVSASHGMGGCPPASHNFRVGGWGGGRHDEMRGVAAGSGGKKTKNEGDEVIGSIFGRD